MFYSNVKKLVELPASPLGFLKNFCRRDEKTDFDRNDDFSRGSPGRRSLREHKSESIFCCKVSTGSSRQTAREL